MARGLDLYKKIQSMNVSPSSPSSQIDNQTVSYKPGAGDSFLNEIEKKQGLLKETSPVNNINISPVPGEKGLDRVAKFLLLLGKEEAAKVLKNLSEDEVEAICSHIAQVKRVDSVEAQLILEEFGFLKTIKPDRSTGGIGIARNILQEAFGVEKARELLEKAVPKSRPVPFDFLSDVELPQLLNLVKDESPMILSVLLSSLPPEKSSQIIKALDKEMRTAVLLRMGRMEKIDPKVIALMEQTLMDRLNKQGKMETIELDGKQKLASILKFLPLSDEKQILEDLALENEALSEEVREQLLTIDAVLHMTDDDLQKVLQDFTEKDLAQLLRGKDEEIQSRILNNLSSRRRQFVLDESEIMGPIRRKDSDSITRDFLEYIKNKEEKGELIIMREEEEYID